MREKISIIGAGNVGATTAQLCSTFGFGDVVLIDIAEGIAQGKALDIQQSLAILQKDCRIKGSADYADIKNSCIVVITAGFARKPGMTREDLIKANGEIIYDIAKKIPQYCPEAIVITVTNPMDVMTYLVQKVSQIPPTRVLGMGGILDSGRFKSFISNYLKISPDQIYALVIGMHGQTMVPLPRHSTVYGQPLPKIIPEEKIIDLTKRTVAGGAEIVGLLQTGSAYFAPAAAIVEMIQCILHEENKILPCSVYLQGEYNQKDIYLGAPVKLHSKGLEKIIELELTPQEIDAFRQSGDSVRSMISILQQSFFKSTENL